MGVVNKLAPPLSDRDYRYGRWKKAIERCMHWQVNNIDTQKRKWTNEKIG